ncbi:MAG TPA: EAL domain-containing protein [Trueperaceae bacterium]|nr:EAL domain-containing protein [Trueperaceae bacterium]
MKYDTPALRYPRLQDLTHQFQPIESAATGGAEWHEALVRWRLPDGTVRGPLDVLPFWLSPTRSDTFTRFTVTRAAAALLDAPGSRLSINLSPSQVTQPSALHALRTLKPELQGRLVVELTEQQIHNLDAYWQGLESLRGDCAMVLLDDVTFDDLDLRFRKGAPIDGIKLDRSLLPALLGGTYHQRAVDLVQDARERFDIVVAEGVEDPTARDHLAGLGVTHLQGFGIGRPVARIPQSRNASAARAGAHPGAPHPKPVGNAPELRLPADGSNVHND